MLLDMPMPATHHNEKSEGVVGRGGSSPPAPHSEPAYPELAVQCPDRVDPDRLLANTGITFEPSAGLRSARWAGPGKNTCGDGSATVACGSDARQTPLERYHAAGVETAFSPGRTW
jgi:hypothetical protein